MRRFIWAVIWLVAFLVLSVVAYFAAEALMSPPRPGPHGFRDQGGMGMGRGLLITAFALFGARFLADRIAPIDCGRSASEPDRLDGE